MKSWFECLKCPKYSLPILMKKQKVQGPLGTFTPMERRESRAGSRYSFSLTSPFPHYFLYFSKGTSHQFDWSASAWLICVIEKCNSEGSLDIARWYNFSPERELRKRLFQTLIRKLCPREFGYFVQYHKVSETRAGTKTWGPWSLVLMEKWLLFAELTFQ